MQCGYRRDHIHSLMTKLQKIRFGGKMCDKGALKILFTVSRNFSKTKVWFIFISPSYFLSIILVSDLTIAALPLNTAAEKLFRGVVFLKMSCLKHRIHLSRILRRALTLGIPTHLDIKMLMTICFKKM